MSKTLKINSVMALLPAIAFYAFFMFTKHDPALSSIIPFASDPYDAIGSFGVLISALLAVLGLFRSFRPYRQGSPSMRQTAFLARTQMAIAMAILIPLGADAIAMGRHISLWAGKAATGEFLALIAGTAALAIGLVLLVRRATRALTLPRIRNPWQRAPVLVPICIVALVLYPERLINSKAGELFSIAAGILLLFIPQSALTVALVPFDTEAGATGKAGLLSQRWIQWGVFTLLGIALGTLALVGEALGEGGGSRCSGIPFARLLEVAAVFIGSATAGMLVAYCCLRTPLGLFKHET